MRLSTRLTVAMVALVSATAAAVGLLTYRNIEQQVLPAELFRLETHARELAQELDLYLAGGRADMMALRAVPAHDSMIRAKLSEGTDATANGSEVQWRDRLTRTYLGQLNAQPNYLQIRLVGIANHGRELIRVERPSAGGPTRVVPEAELEMKGDRDYFRRAIRLAPGEIHVTPIELNRENGTLQTPPVPIARVATALHSTSGEVEGIVVIKIDMRAALDRLREAMQLERRVFLVNEAGDYLVHPDRTREFGFAVGRPARWQQDFPELAGLIGGSGAGRHLVHEISSEPAGVALASIRVAGGPQVTVIESVPRSVLMAPAVAAGRATVIGASMAVVAALVLALFLARSLSRPLTEMTAGVEGFAGGGSLRVPIAAGGEIGVLARAFARMASEVQEQTAAVRRNAEILDKTIASLSDGLLVVDAAGRTLIANPACKELFGDRPDIGSPEWQKTYLRFRADGVTPCPPGEAPIGRAIRGESFDNLDIVVRRADQTQSRHVVASGRAIRDAAGRHEGAVIIYRDLTALRETERQLRHSQKMDAVGQLTGGVAHDFNNILTVILGTSEILQDGLADRPQLAELAHMIDEASSRGAELTRQLLAFARRQALEPRETDVNRLVVETSKLLKATLGEQVEIESMLEDGVWRAMIDPSQLTTALLNLAVNARDAMPAGGKLTIETGNVILDETYAEANREVKPGPHVMIAVSDTGGGIPAEIREKVFEPFFTTKEVGKGTGLGLSMVYGFVKQSGGHVKIYSEEGHGTTVKLYLPWVEKGASAVPDAAASVAPGGSETILVVEDDELVRDYVVAQLRSLGYTTLSASNGDDALALVEQGAHFDLLFTDVIMPGGMNGRQLADELTRRKPSVCVLYTSGYTEDAIVHHGRLDAGVALLSKPYRKTDLARKIREVLGAASRAA